MTSTIQLQVKIQWNELPRKTNSRFLGHMTEMICVKDFSGVANLFLRWKDKKLVFTGLFECGESKYDIYFWLE